MSYGDFIFPVNPYQIRVSHGRNAAEQKIPLYGSTVSDIGRTALRISGEGEFFGENALESFRRLKTLFEAGGGAMLYVPSQAPLYAVFETLELMGSDMAGVIRYRFSFVERRSFYHTEKTGELLGNGVSTLWDMAAGRGLSCHWLLEVNPDIARPDQPVPPGKRVRLC